MLATLLQILKHGSFTFAYPSFIILLELYRQRTYACFVVLGNCLCCNANLYCSVHRENEWRAAMLMGVTMIMMLIITIMINLSRR